MVNTMTLFDYGLVGLAITIATVCAWFLLADSRTNKPRLLNSRVAHLLRGDATSTKRPLSWTDLKS